MKIDTLKEYCKQYSAANAARQLNVLAQQVHDTLRKNVPVFVEHEDGIIKNCYLKKKWGKL